MASDEAALFLEWSFGLNHKLANNGVHSLCDGNRVALVYAAAHSGVIYDCIERTQKILQGHCNDISAIVVSHDKKLIATADKGDDSIVVVWDSYEGTPIRTIFSPAPHGVRAMDMSPDNAYLATLSAVPSEDGLEAHEQMLCIWDWTDSDRETPLHECIIPLTDVQTCVKFNGANPGELVTNGAKHVIFWTFNEEGLLNYSPKIQKSKFRSPIAPFTVSAFMPNSVNSQAITATRDGFVMVWEGLSDLNEDGQIQPSERMATKIINLSQGSISVVQVVDNYIALGGEDGAVRFYDNQFRLESWFEDMDAGPITSISFASTPAAANKEGGSGLDFAVPDFMVGTTQGYVVGMESSLFEEVDAENRRGTLLVQGMSDEVHGIASHPSRPEVLISSYSGGLYLWDYSSKVLLMVRQFDASRLRPRCATFDTTGSYICVGFTSGIVKLLEPSTFDDIMTFKNFSEPIVHVEFSPKGDWLAVADSDGFVGLWELQHHASQQEERAPILQDDPSTRQWMHIGRVKSHAGPVGGLSFNVRESGVQTLVSIGSDRRLIEYDLTESTVEAGVALKDDEPIPVDEETIPTAVTWHPLLGDGDWRDFEDRVVTAHSSMKLMQWNADNKSCRRTSLGPTFGGPITHISGLVHHLAGKDAESSTLDGRTARTIEQFKPYYAYATSHKVVGLGKFPLDGNPHKAMGLIAHPGPVADIAVSFDCRFMFTSGGPDGTVNMWAIHTPSIDLTEEASVSVGESSNPMAPFLSILEGGEGGDLHNDIIEYFYYAQLRTQGEDTTAPREVSGKVPLTEIPNLMRALGYYPSEREVGNMVNEVKYSEFTMTGEVRDSISLDEFIRLYLNHRPVVGVSKPQVEEAFKVIAEALNSTNGTFQTEVEWSQLKKLLQSTGEKLGDADLKVCMKALIGTEELPGKFVSSDDFISDVLGFEDFEQEESFMQ